MTEIIEYEIKNSNGEQKKYPLLRLEVADNFWSRFCGLMLRKTVGKADGLLLRPCNSVHMCFMRFCLDIVYLDENAHILKIDYRLRPWTGMSWCRKAVAAVELPDGKAMDLGLRIGDIISPRPR